MLVCELELINYLDLLEDGKIDIQKTFIFEFWEGLFDDVWICTI